ncbi:hypothetical protein BDP27DRAFT_1335820 [Rhodocollybia butyracea]|uniref:EF-hand domain-containing protein n=1 Tax=Rhodocollybia butyracea TaxID=206335 RepID=A0A9P5PGY2_9AGAR|nr:hypothetical protein BDP27DRAFT_1335820 [Rhodocollybia butyracea]
MNTTTFQPPYTYSNGGRTPKGTASMDSFVDFNMNNEELRLPTTRKGFSSPLSLFRNRKKSAGDLRDKTPPRPVSNVHNDTFDPYASRETQLRALPPLPRSEPTSASFQPLSSASSSASSQGPQGLYAPLRMSPEASVSEFNSSLPPQVYEGLPNPYDSNEASLAPLHANHGPPMVYPSPPPQPQNALDTAPPVVYPSPPLQPQNALDAALQKNGQNMIDESHMLDQNLAPELFLAEGVAMKSSAMKTNGMIHTPHHKQSIEIMKKIALSGATHLNDAEAVLEEFTASPVWDEGKEMAQTLLEPAKDVVQLFDALTPFVPMLIVAKSVFSIIVQKELDRRQNDKNMGIIVLTITKFWYTLCDLNVIFKIQSSKTYTDFHELAKNVVDKMNEFGNFQNIYRKHGHIVHTIKSLPYKTKITAFIDAFKDFQAQLQTLLAQFSALTINNVDQKTDQLNQKMDKIIAAINTLSPTERRMQEKIEDYGGEEEAFRNPRFLNEISSELGTKLTTQLTSILREDLDSQLESNKAMFKLQLEQTTKDMEQTIERSTDAILTQMDSGPHELIQNDEVKEIWKEMKWRLSCKTRHFVDALHHYYVQKFSEHQKSKGEPHPDQWTLKFTGRAIFQPAIGDAIDSDASGYISIDEINRFTAHCPKSWSIPIFLAHAAVGWYQNSLVYRSRCVNALHRIERCTKRMLPRNRKHIRPYFENWEALWLIVDSLNTDTFQHQQEDLRFQFEKLTLYRRKFMEQIDEQLKSNLSRTSYRMHGSEDVRVVMGTSRCEALVLPMLMLLLERHARIIETAENFILDDREFQDMIMSIRSVTYAFGKRYSILTEGWRQQRFDIPLQISSFAYGIFVNWHTNFRSTPYEPEYPELHVQESTRHNRHSSRIDEPGPVEDSLTYELPVQPSADELRRLRAAVRPRSSNTKKNDVKAKERYGSMRMKTKRLSRLGMNVEPKSPAIDVVDSHVARGPKRPNSAYQFEFADPDGVLRAINTSEIDVSGYASADSSEVHISYTKGKILTLDDRIRSVEEEINGMKNMLVQLLAISKSQGQ